MAVAAVPRRSEHVRWDRNTSRVERPHSRKTFLGLLLLLLCAHATLADEVTAERKKCKMQAKDVIKDNTCSQYKQNNSDDKGSSKSGIIVLIFFAVIMVSVLALVIYFKCTSARRQPPSRAGGAGGGNSIDYKVKLIEPGMKLDIKGRLNDISTGSPDIPGWDQEKDVVKAERMITAN